MSKPQGFRNVPPPVGSKAGASTNRFIPREELGSYASWQPGAIDRRAESRPHPGSAPAAPATESDSAERQARVSSLVSTARQAGYQDGYRDGTAALESFKQSFASQATAQVGALLDGFDRQFAALDGRVAQAVAGVAVQLAQQVLRAELQARPELVARVASEAINSVMFSARHIGVQVHPLDLPLVAEGAEEALKARGARLLSNPAIERGGVLVESDVGTVDARIATRWAQAAAALGAEQPWHMQDSAT
jgi:flagellar assembly protein FliH